MTYTKILSLLVMLALVPATAFARQEPPPDTNVNARYTIESVSIVGVEESRVSQVLLAEIKKLVGTKYNQTVAHELAAKLRDEIHYADVNVKVVRGAEAEHVKVVFEAESMSSATFDVGFPRLVYYTDEGFSGAVNLSVNTHHNVFSVGLVSTADPLLERYTGETLRYEHRNVGTDKLHIRVDYEYLHPSFDARIDDALVAAPSQPGTYRVRQNFAPSVSVLPIPGVKLSFGTSLQTLHMLDARGTTDRAYAFTAGIGFKRTIVGATRSVEQKIGADYAVRAARESLGSNLVYTRQLFSADYSLTVRRQSFAAHAEFGSIDGQAPLFERFTLGNAFALRGWNKFDVAPLGGSRLAYGSLEYRYRPFVVFYDFGAVWDAPAPATARHSVGIGLVWKSGFFVSIAYPIRLDHVTPSVMFGLKY